MHNYREASARQIAELLGEYQRTKDEMGELAPAPRVKPAS
jgi:hypothetical protein